MHPLRHLTTLAWLATALVAVVAAEVSAEPHARPNIVLVMPDDVGYGDYGCHGNPIIKTPSVDAFWGESVRFTQFHVSPTCSPTRSAIMTGRHEFKNGVTHTILERERMTLAATTLAQVLKRAGYATGIFGKWHLGDEAAYQPNERGFDEVYIHGAGGIGQTYPGSCGDAPYNTNINPALMHNGVFEKTEGYCTDLFFAAATRWIDSRRDAGGPFFAYIPLNAAHGPHVLPEEYYQQYVAKVQLETAKFFGMIENVDKNFGELLARLKAWGIEENTLVIYMNDNGGTAGTSVYNAGLRAGKGTPYQGGTRSPSMWRWPAAFDGGRDCAALAAHIDIFPTLAEIVGQPLEGDLKKQVEGRSLLPLLKDANAPWAERTLVTHSGRWPIGEASSAKFVNCRIQNSRFTLVNNRELYDLTNDPGETTNVIDKHPDVVAELRQAYDQWWNDVQPLLVNEAAVGPKINPYKELYWRQFGGEPDEALLRAMDPERFERGGPAKSPRRKGKGKARRSAAAE